MRKIIFLLIVVIIVLLILIFLQSSDNLIFKYSRQAAQTLETRKDIPGIRIQKLKFTSSKLSSWNRIVWKDVSSQIILKKRNEFLVNQNFDVHINSLEVVLANALQKKFILIAKGINAAPSGIKKSSSKIAGQRQEGLEKGSLKIEFNFDFLSPGTARDQISELYKKIGKIIDPGQTVIPINFSGISSFTMEDRVVKAMVTARRNMRGYYSLVVNKEFFQTIAWFMLDFITDAEASLLSVNAVKVPKLLNIMNDAKRESEKYKEDKSVPEDAYRHVLWSYLLTMEYGPEFAEKITDAHEEGDNTNTEAEHKMDYNNNAVGRQYALKQYKRDQILPLLLRDPKVIRVAK